MDPCLRLRSSVRDSVLCLCELGWLYSKVSAYVEAVQSTSLSSSSSSSTSGSGSRGVMVQSFGFALQVNMIVVVVVVMVVLSERGDSVE